MKKEIGVLHVTTNIWEWEALPTGENVVRTKN